jgi:hypothetical protein
VLRGIVQLRFIVHRSATTDKTLFVLQSDSLLTMVSPTEESFRRTQRTLDELIEAATPELVERGISATDESHRNYHYKNQLLSWSYRFESRRSYRGPEIAMVTVRVTFNEPFDPDAPQDVRMWSRSEIFQIGQGPRWEHTEDRLLPIADVLGRGIAELVCTAIAVGHAEIDAK